jgi:primosomal protein N' (replication factor Y)
VAGGDYLPVFETEIAQREDQGLPPFTSLVHLMVSAPTDGTAEAAGSRLASSLQSTATGGSFRLQGPAPAPIARLRGRFRWQILASGPDPAGLRQWVLAALSDFRKGEVGRQAQIQVDPDPVALC